MHLADEHFSETEDITRDGIIGCYVHGNEPGHHANRIGFTAYGGPFSLVELKVIQEVITLAVFMIFTLLVFRSETFRLNHIIGFVFLILAVYFIFKK